VWVASLREQVSAVKKRILRKWKRRPAVSIEVGWLTREAREGSRRRTAEARTDAARLLADARNDDYEPEQEDRQAERELLRSRRVGLLSGIGSPMLLLGIAGALRLWGLEGLLAFGLGVSALIPMLLLYLRPRQSSHEGKVGTKRRRPGAAAGTRR
jgi:hypothetical protein